MTQKTTNVVAFLLLSIMFISAFSSYLGDSLTMDELSHIPAGYSYLSQKDFRINPEHPPLIKDLAAFPLLFLNLNFPSDSDSWNKEVNSQWRYGWELLYNSGNNPEQMIFWARLPMVFVLLVKKRIWKQSSSSCLNFIYFLTNPTSSRPTGYN